jgi:enterochelin esterase family protein
MNSKLLLFATLIVSLIFSQTACAQKSATPTTATVTDWTIEKKDVPKGRTESLTIDDRQYNRPRKIWVYTPPGYDAGKAAAPNRLIITFDGEDYIKDIPAPVILDNLLAAGKIYPTVQVFVDNSEDRLGDLANHQKFADFVAKDLLPWVQSNYRVGKEPDKIVLAGYSAGGLAAAFVGFKYPNLFGNVFAQSGAFWRGNEGASTPSEWVTEQYRTAAKLNQRFYLEVGGAENIKGVGGSTMIETNQRLRDVLISKGYEVSYREVPNAVHNPEHWRAQFADGIIYLIGKK